MGLSLLFFAFMHLVHLAFMQPICHDNELSALLRFKESFIINEHASGDVSAYPKMGSWKLDEENGNCCLWDGIKCDEHAGHVIMLDLSSSLLYGSINSSSTLFDLVYLQWLSLADNHFNFSNIPSGIVNLSRLSHLNLSSSKFSGQIPSEMLELSELVSFDVSTNDNLELRNPSLANLVEKLINLIVLDLTHVNIFSSIPPALTNLSSLTFLSLSVCGLQGKIPPSLDELTNLDHLDLSYNELSGESLPSLGNLTQISYLAVSSSNSFGINSNSLSWISNLKQLTTLRLPLNNITGEIPPMLKNLTQLTELVLNRNQLTGPIPSWLFSLNKLNKLYLYINQLTGHIPIEIGNLTQLQYVRFALNQLKGSIPSSVFELKNLRWLDLYANNLIGTVDLNMFLLNFKSLSILVLSSNKLSLLTSTLVNTTLQSFNVVGLSSCNLTEFPYFLHNQDQLMTLDLSSNKITGQLPKWLFNVSVNRLQYLNLSFNLLTGFDPKLLVLPWTTLVTLDLAFNNLQGPLPIPSRYTDTYLISNNQLLGEIPPRICSLNSLYALDLSYNKLSGILPECLGNFSRELSKLKLRGNNFHGTIPPTFMKGSKLTMLDLSKNLLEGRIPRSLANCVKLVFLNLGNNQITDVFPFWLGFLPELRVLILKSNRFYGEIKVPKIGFEFLKLQIIDLSENRFTGTLPSKYFQYWNGMKDINAKNLTYLQNKFTPRHFPVLTYYGSSYYSLAMSNKGTELEYEKLSNLIIVVILSNNQFEGEIPPSIADLKGLRSLNLSNNNLEGHIPSSMNNLTVLESLDLSNNNLSGEIPQQLGELTTLSFFNVSYNHLTGPIPQGKQFNTFGNDSFNGNPELCGEPLSKKCENSEVSQEEDPHSESSFAFGWKIAMIGYASGTIIGLVLGHIFSSRKHEWLANTLGLRLKTTHRKRRHTN